ncbi:class I SAM-dependent methyltransferase [Blastopirellula sp. JC732]|uniref:Class I SAM-dependent methyltransferase n=1 Tax=Blastopirellula sediminis TaxID=2894196 RepID=A0A9X1SLP6_9BACT|nr:class I SAM-dependent methyltransferase [Blastopirellula sediminis]MCC9605816.1 class I SAM-dependent methyltransferase [Blastopirellula sediminis]MCC9630884.1 class I SAM-dependent methyltransferase [Blastopirellula sediminis]
MDKDAIDSVKALFEQWELYDAVIQHDYMQHQTLAAAIQQYAAAKQLAGRALDLGCGDSYLAARALGELPLTEYAGVDLSESALQRAKERWAESPIPATFSQSDFATYLPDQAAASFDLVLGSYSIHHFSPERKEWLLGEIRRVLKPTGSFIWSDIVCCEGQTYTACIDQLAIAMRSEWNQLTSRQLDIAIEHIRASDFPETEAWMIEKSAAAGLRFDAKLMEKPHFSAYAFVPST